MSEFPNDRPTLPSKLPPQTVERWRQIVQRAVRNGTDVSQLVQHFAERAFENKTVSLDSQGARRRALTQMRQTLTREVNRGKKALAEHADSKRPTLLRPYQGITLTFLPPQKSNKQVKKASSSHVVPLSMDGDTQASKSAPLKDKFETHSALRSYIATLEQQGTAIDEEMAQIDEVLNRGMHNRDGAVAELSATTQELWRIAQIEVAAAAASMAAIRAAAAPPPAVAQGGTQGSAAEAPADPLTAPTGKDAPAAASASAEPAQGTHAAANAAGAVTAGTLATAALNRGQALLSNMQAMFKKKG